MMKMYMLFKVVCQVSFYVAFVLFSYDSVREFVQGKSAFRIFQENVNGLKFPDLTFCPRQERSLAYLNTKKLQKDLNLKSFAIKGYGIYMTIGQNSSILENYSFTLEESIHGNSFKLEKYNGNGVLKNQTEYEKVSEVPIAAASGYGARVEIPVRLKVVKTQLGACFALHSEELATIEPRYQGWMIKLSPETDWLLYVGSPGYSFPDYSPNTNLNQFTLKRNTSSFISFKPEKYVRLARRGYFDTEDHCMENIELSDTITCFKKCFVERLEIDCQPEVLNVFDETNLTTCSQNKSNEVYSTLSKTSPKDNFCPACLVPCETIEYTFQVENVEENEPGVGGTEVRINAKKLWMTGTTEELVYEIPNLLVSVGGFLGLFVGLSLLDVVEFVADWVAKLCNK